MPNILELRSYFESLPPSLAALSGGVDSSLVALLLGRGARDSGARHVLAHVAGPHVPPIESERARECARLAGLELVELEFSPLDAPHVATAGRMRCYHCKKALFSRLCDVAGERGLKLVLDGSNASDLEGWRPGLQALAELGVSSPLLERGVTKTRVRELAREMGLPWWGAPARPCLLTRFGYDLPVTDELLRKVGAAERELENLLPGDFRLRLPEVGRPVLQVEFGVEGGVEGDARALMRRAAEIVAAAGLEGELSLVAGQGVSGWYDRGERA